MTLEHGTLFSVYGKAKNSERRGVTTAAIAPEIAEVVRETLQIDRATLLYRDFKLVKKLKIDSLEFVTLVAAIEERFGIELTDDEAGSFVTLGNIEDTIAFKLHWEIGASFVDRSFCPPKIFAPIDHYARNGQPQFVKSGSTYAMAEWRDYCWRYVGMTSPCVFIPTHYEICAPGQTSTPPARETIQ